MTTHDRACLHLAFERGQAYKVIPVMVDGIEPAGLSHWFPEEPVGLRLPVGPGGVQDILPALRDGLDLSLPIDARPSVAIATSPVADLTLELSDPYVDRSDGKHRFLRRPPGPTLGRRPRDRP